MFTSDCIRFIHSRPPYNRSGVHHFPDIPRNRPEPERAAPKPEPPDPAGLELLAFREWWERTEVEISVGGERIVGIPAFVEGGALRVINENRSYFIPLSKVDYIRTKDGLCTTAVEASPLSPE